MSLLLTTLLVFAQLPRMMPAAEGYPATAFKAAITYERIGLTPVAAAWAEQLWQQRDPETGLWASECCGVDTVNPMFAVILYEDLGQHERALETYRNHVARARAIEEMPYNGHWWPVVSALVTDQPLPMDLLIRAAPGLSGRYSAAEEPDDHGRYYADQMMAWWNWANGPTVGPYYNSPWCGRRADWLKYGQAECQAQMAWRNGEFWWPVIDGSAPFVYSDEILMLAVLR